MYKNLPDMDYWVVSVKKFGESKETVTAFVEDFGAAHRFANEARSKGYTVAIWDMFHPQRGKK